MLYNLAQNPISDRLRKYLLAQVPETPPQEVLEKIRAKLKGKKLGDWFEKLTFIRNTSVDDPGGGRPRFFIHWGLQTPMSPTDSDVTRQLIIDGIAINDLRDDLTQEVKPPDKLAVLHGYSSEGYMMPKTWFYCLPEEVEPLKKKALDDAMRPFRDIEEIDFTKPPEPLEFEIGMNLSIEEETEGPNTADILDQAAEEIPPVTDPPADSIST